MLSPNRPSAIHRSFQIDTNWLRLARLVLWLLLIAHYLACAFFALGHFSTAKSWIQARGGGRIISPMKNSKYFNRHPFLLHKKVDMFDILQEMCERLNLDTYFLLLLLTRLALASV